MENSLTTSVAIADKPLKIEVTIWGIPSKNSVIITTSDRATLRAASSLIPARADNAVTASAIAAPTDRHESPKRATAPLSFNMEGITGFSSFAATPSVVKATAIANTPFAIAAQPTFLKAITTPKNAVNPIVRPVPAAANPIPNATRDALNVANAPLNLNITDITGFIAFIPFDIMKSVPAKVANAIIELIISPPRSFIAPARMINDVETTTRLAASLKLPLKFFSINANAPIEAPRAIKPFAKSSHDNFPISPNAFAISVILLAITGRTADASSISCGFISRVAPAIENSDAASAVIPLAISSQLIFANSFIGETSIRIQIASENITTAELLSLWAFPIRLENPANAPNKAVIATQPFAISFQFIAEKSPTTFANILREAAKAIIAIAFDIIPLFIFTARENPISPPISAATPTSPFATSSQPSAERSEQTEPNIFTAEAIITICAAPLAGFPTETSLNAPVNIPNKAAMLSIEFINRSGFISEMRINALASILTETDIIIRALAAISVPVLPCPSFFITTIAILISVNIPVRALSATSNFSCFIPARAISDSANIPTAAAILRSISALRFCCQACKLLLTESRTPEIPSKILSTFPKSSENAPPIFLAIFLALKSNTENIDALNIDNNLAGLSVDTASVRESQIPENILPSPEPIFFTNPHKV